MGKDISLTSKSKGRKREIIEKASSIFSKSGYFGSSLDEIAKELNIKKASLYYYVDGKDDLWIQCHQYSMEKLKRAVEGILQLAISTEEKLFKVFKYHVELTVSSLPQDAIVPNELKKKMVNERDWYDQTIDKLLTKGVNEKVFKDLDVKITRLLLLGSLNRVHNWYSDNGQFSKEEIAEKIAESLMLMLKK